MSTVAGKKITTIEAQADNKGGKTVQEAWVKHDVAQCGDCQSGQMISAATLLSRIKSLTDVQIDAAMSGNICRCGTYQRIRVAIKDTAKTRVKGAPP